MCTTCSQCQLLKVMPRHIIPPTVKIKTAAPFELVAADLVEFGRTSRGNLACLMIVDHNSKWVCAVPLQNKQSKTVCDAMKYHILPKIPDKLLVDNGPEFTAGIFEDLLENSGIKHIYSTPFRSAGNGAVERVNCNIGTLLASLTTEQKSWDDHIPQAMQTYILTLHREISMSLSQYLLTKAHQVEVCPSLPICITGMWKPEHPRFSPFNLGEKVMHRIPFQSRCTVDKFKAKFDGPYVVTKVNPNDVTYHIQRMLGAYPSIRAHYDQLRLWKD